MSIVRFDPIPRLQVTKLMEQTLVLLLTLRSLGTAKSAAADWVQAQGYWRGTLPDFDPVWQELQARKYVVVNAGGRCSLTALGTARLNDLCTLAYALRDPFHHLTTAAYTAACEARKGMRKRPFTNCAASKQPPQAQKGKYHVYVILLRSERCATMLISWTKTRNGVESYPWLYVGCTGGTPTDRFQAHLHGRLASKIVRDYGVCLVPDLYVYLNPINGRWQAEETEGRFSRSLRKQGYTVTAGHHDWK
ncbi:MAG: hypothetical protein IPJ94_11450 [Chloroflexi bacterium]|nr:hypothetical protein [Chloroflexota bacterium]